MMRILQSLALLDGKYMIRLKQVHVTCQFLLATMANTNPDAVYTGLKQMTSP